MHHGRRARNVDFYTRVLGLRLVKKTVNQDDPTVYHLFYADEDGSAGADITFFEYPGARRGRAGDGMVHTVSFRVASTEALAFWEARSRPRASRRPRETTGCASRTPRASASSSSSRRHDEPLVARHPEIPPSTRFRDSTASARSPRAPRRAARCSSA